MRTRLLLLALLLLAGGAFFVWRSLPPRVTLAEATTGPAIEAVYATGSVEPVQLARVGPALRGRLMAVLVEEGQRVTQGQVMARLDDREAHARLVELEARAAFAQEDLNRTRQLVARDIATRAQADRAESEARATRSAFEAQQRRLDDYAVRAPAAGVVLRRDAEIGEIVDTPAVLFQVGEIRPLRVTAEVDEEDIARVQPGQRALIRAEAFPGQALPATVATITPMGNSSRKAYRVRLALPDDTPLLIGMTVEANIVLREDPAAVLVPGSAVREGRVFLVQDGIARARPVRPGVQGPRMTEIREGLRPGERIILNPPAGLADGQGVHAQP